MSYQGISGWLSVDRVDVSLARAVVVLSVLALGLSFFASEPLLLMIPLAAGTGGGLYLLTQPGRTTGARSWNETSHVTASSTLPAAVIGYLPSLVVLGTAGLVVSIFRLGARTAPVYLLTGAIGVAIFVQVLFVEHDRIAPGVVLAQILVTAVVIRLSALYVTPGFVGVDIWTHATVFVDGIASTGSLAPLSGDKYVMAPVYHVVAAVGSVLLGGARNGIYLTLGLLVPLSALFIYATGRMLLPARWALLATGFYAFSDQFIRWGLHVIPTSLGLVFFIAAVYAMTRLLSEDAEGWAVGLLFAVTVAVIFTHQVSTVITLVLVGTAALVAVVMALTDDSVGSGASIRTAIGSRDSIRTAIGSGARARKALALSGVFVLALVTTITSWALTPFSGGSFLGRELVFISEAIAEDAGFLNLVGSGGVADSGLTAAGETSGLFGAAVPYVELIGFTLLLLASVLGGLYILYRDGPSDIMATYLLSGGLMFVFTFGLSLFGIRALFPGRWVAFLYVMMALIGAAGLYYLSGIASRRVVFALFVVVALGYPTTMVVAEKATLDDPAFADEHARFSFTEAELAAVETIRESEQPNAEATIATDQPYVSLFRRVGGYGYGASVLELGPNGPVDTDAAVYRTYQSTGPVGFERAASAPGFELGTNVEESVCPTGWNSAYANREVKYCTPTEGSR